MELLLTKYTRAIISYEGISRIETYEYPKEALREALLNAITHKDYAGCIPIQISVYPDKIMMWNEGQLPENWTIKNLLSKHSSRPYNPDIANAFFRSGYVEAWGRGIDKITGQCISAGLPIPQFSPEGSDFWVVFRKDTYNKEDLSKLGLNERQVEALIFFKSKGEITSSEYAKKYNISDRTARRDLSELIEKKLVKNEGDTSMSKYFFV
jgi:ATP-dependent DNA helicase RecG